jgi:hypothetical protein
MIWKDPVVEEVRKIRAEIAAENDFDFDKFSNYLYELQSNSPRKPLKATHMKHEKVKKGTSK